MARDRRETGATGPETMLDLFQKYKLHHVGVVFPNLRDAELFLTKMGMEEASRGFVEVWSCWCIFVKGADSALLELVAPEGGPLARFNKGAGGVHHFALEVPDILSASAAIEASGMKMLEAEPVQGAGPFLCNFIHPFATRGIQIELVQLI
jgi:methylmalonyl-CoA epimerase